VVGLVACLEICSMNLRQEVTMLRESGGATPVTRAPVSGTLVVDQMPLSPWHGRRVRVVTWVDRCAGVAYSVTFDPSTNQLLASKETAIDGAWAIGATLLRIGALVGLVLMGTRLVSLGKAKWGRTL
jgi:hypothetical protein